MAGVQRLGDTPLLLLNGDQENKVKYEVNSGHWGF